MTVLKFTATPALAGGARERAKNAKYPLLFSLRSLRASRFKKTPPISYSAM